MTNIIEHKDRKIAQLQAQLKYALRLKNEWTDHYIVVERSRDGWLRKCKEARKEVQAFSEALTQIAHRPYEKTNMESRIIACKALGRSEEV